VVVVCGYWHAAVHEPRHPVDTASRAPIYEVDAERLAGLRPDLILTQGLCDVCALPARAVRHAPGHLSPRPPILSLDARTMDGVLDSMREISAQTGREHEAQVLVEHLQAQLARVTAAVAGLTPWRTAA
jgi:iron complex transport system substrate-binding protein